MDQAPYISINADQLRVQSEPATESQGKDIIKKLLQTIPDNGLGLSAPQILEFKRVFLARLSMGAYAFINPRFESKSSDQVASTESCLSLPHLVRTISRHKHVNLTADHIFAIENDTLLSKANSLILRGKDAFVVQHEYNHLDGILLVDLPEVPTAEDKSIDRDQKRREKIAKRRQDKKIQGKPLLIPKLSPKTILKRQAEDRKRHKKIRRQIRENEIRVREREQQKIDDAGLFAEPPNPVNDDLKGG